MLDVKDSRLLDKSKSTLTDGYLPVGNYIVMVVTDGDYATAKPDRNSQSGHTVFLTTS